MMRVLSERLVGNYEIVATEKETEKLSLNEVQESLKIYCDDTPRQRQRRGCHTQKPGKILRN
jgi:hypothetical protein